MTSKAEEFALSKSSERLLSQKSAVAMRSTKPEMADVFHVKVPTINEHLQRLYAEAKLNTRQLLGNS
jgi:hypothetical protein